MVLELDGQRLGAFVAGGADDEGGDELGAFGVVLADDGRLGHGGVFDEGALDLEGADAVGRRGDDVVVAALEPEVAVGVAPRLVTGGVPAVAEALRGRLGVAVVAVKEADGTLRLVADGDVADAVVGRPAAVLVEDLDVVAGYRLAHRARAHRHRAVVGDQARGLGLAVGVIDRQSGGVAPDLDDLGVQRLARARAVPQVRQLVAGEVGLDEEAIQRRRRAERRDPRLPQDGEDRVGIGLAERDLHDRRALVPLPEQSAPRGLGPAGVGHGPVAVAVA